MLLGTGYAGVLSTVFTTDCKSQNDSQAIVADTHGEVNRGIAHSRV